MCGNGIQLGDGGLSKPFILYYMVLPAGSKVMLGHGAFLFFVSNKFAFF